MYMKLRTKILFKYRYITVLKDDMAVFAYFNLINYDYITSVETQN